MSIDLDLKIIRELGYKIYQIDVFGVWVYLPFEQSNPVLFKPSDNMRDAWIVVEELENKYEQMIFAQTDLKDGLIVGYEVEFFDYKNTGRSFRAKSISFPIAVCLAGVKALSFLKEEETISESINKMYS